MYTKHLRHVCYVLWRLNITTSIYVEGWDICDSLCAREKIIVKLSKLLT